MSGGTIVLKGTKKVIVVGIKFTNEASHEYSISQVNTAAHAMANFYNGNSRGLLQVDIETHLVNVPFIGSNTGVLSHAGPYIKTMFPGKDIYVIISKFVNGDHAGSGFAYVKTTLSRDIEHECGHCLKLAHSGAYIYDSKGNYTYDDYGDGLSPMSKFGNSSCLTSPQYFFLSWTPSSEIVTIDEVNKLPATFQLKRINNFGKAGISTIIFKAGVLKNPTGRDAFLSFPQYTKFFGSKPFAALHFRLEGGSAKIKTFGSGYYDSDFTGLNMKIESGSTTDLLIITVSLNIPTISYTPEDVPEDDSDV
jgi:hypothetical protein